MMIRITLGDLLAVAINDKYYYALVLDRIQLFGGNWTFVFHRTSDQLLAAEEILSGPQSGFHAFVDFIWAKREGRITRLAKKINVAPYDHVKFLKNTHTDTGKATTWFISDRQFREVKRTSQLSEDEAKAPLEERIDDTIMAERVDRMWTPETDERI